VVDQRALGAAVAVPQRRDLAHPLDALVGGDPHDAVLEVLDGAQRRLARLGRHGDGHGLDGRDPRCSSCPGNVGGNASTELGRAHRPPEPDGLVERQRRDQRGPGIGEGQRPRAPVAHHGQEVGVLGGQRTEGDAVGVGPVRRVDEPGPAVPKTTAGPPRPVKRTCIGDAVDTWPVASITSGSASAGAGKTNPRRQIRGVGRIRRRRTGRPRRRNRADRRPRAAGRAGARGWDPGISR